MSIDAQPRSRLGDLVGLLTQEDIGSRRSLAHRRVHQIARPGSAGVGPDGTERDIAEHQSLRVTVLPGGSVLDMMAAMGDPGHR